jgi:hypothetical protein
MKLKQHERFQKIMYENIYLLKIHNNNDLVFKVSGSTSNIYSVRIYKTFEWNNIFCDCPDAKKWANMYGVMCKHCIFIIFKVLKLFTYTNTLSTITTTDKGEEFLEKRTLHKDYIEVINVFLDVFKFDDSNDFIRPDYVEKYNQMKDTIRDAPENKTMEKRENCVDYCIICFDTFEIETMLSKEYNAQCLVCKNIFHKECLNKWFTHNKTCPYCRSPCATENDTENLYINLFN